MSYEPDFKPSDVQLLAPFPLAGALGNIDEPDFGLDKAAFLIVRTCQMGAGDWVAVCAVDIAFASAQDMCDQSLPFRQHARYAGAFPNFYSLAAQGYARWPHGVGGPIEFTEQGYERLRRYVQRSTSAGGGAS